MMNSDNQEENLNYSAVVQSDKENYNIEEEHDLNEEDYENANSKPIENDHEAMNEVDDFEKENSDSLDNLPMGGDIAKSRSRFQNSKLQQEKKGVETNPALQRRRSSQDIFERIDNYRGGEGEVKLKDLVLFLRGVYDNIDDNFEVMLLLNQLALTGEKKMNLKEWLAMIGDLCDAGWEGTEPGQDFDQLSEEDLRAILEDFEESSEKKPTKVYKKPAGAKKEKKRSLKEVATKTIALNVFNVDNANKKPITVVKNQFKKRPRQGASNKRRGSLFDD